MDDPPRDWPPLDCPSTGPGGPWPPLDAAHLDVVALCLPPVATEPCNPAQDSAHGLAHARVSPDAWETLAPDERARAQRLRRPEAQRQFILVRLALRQLLSGLTSTPAPALRFTSGRHGKPSLISDSPQQTLAFNLSHTRGLALIALHPSAHLGIDVECIRPSLDAPALAQRYFTPTEAHAILALPQGSAQLERFLRVWARKEAFMKAVGHGVAMGLDRFEVDASDHASGLRWWTLPPDAPDGLPADPAQWTLRDLNAPMGFFAACAASAPGLKPRLWRWVN
jgi:4'-phosphopantetheinyl transferase